MSNIQTLIPKLGILTFDGVPINGFSADSTVEAERASDAFEKHVGTQGEVSRIKNADMSGHVTISLAQTSPSNDYLSAKARMDELTANGIGLLTFVDLSGTIGQPTRFSGMAWVKKLPALEEGKTIKDRKWVFDVAYFDVWLAGNMPSL
jgi:hypothetical protein